MPSVIGRGGPVRPNQLQRKQLSRKESERRQRLRADTMLNGQRLRALTEGPADIQRAEWRMRRALALGPQGEGQMRRIRYV